MEAELLQLAREAVAALQLQAAAANSTTWGEIAQIFVSIIGLGGIFWGLGQMQQAGKRRDKEIDVIAENMREGVQALKQQGQALERQGEVLAELLRRTA